MLKTHTSILLIEDIHISLDTHDEYKKACIRHSSAIYGGIKTTYIVYEKRIKSNKLVVL